MRRTKSEWIHGPRWSLAAAVDLPAPAETASAPERWALFCHGFGSFKEFKPLVRIARALNALDWGVVRFDFGGLGSSGGDFGETSFLTQQDDVRRVHQWMAERDAAPQLLLGHSLGGATLLSLAPSLPATHVVTLGAPSDTKHLAEALVRMQPDLRVGDGEVKIAGARRKITQSMLQVLRESDFSESVCALQQRLLILQPEADEMVAAWHAERLAEWSSQPNAVHLLAGADHLLSRDEHIDAAIDLVIRHVQNDAP